MKFKLIIKKILAISITFSLGGVSGNFFTKNYYSTHYEQRLAEVINGSARFIPDPEHENAYMKVPIAVLDSLETENKEMQRWKRGRR